ncbi:MAG: xanthine dehydrogenase accessory protein XdhC [Beijerinckiaceae bacterium]
MHQSLATVAREWREARNPFIFVEIRRAEGSTPREEGAAMAVTLQSVAGTIGGGRLEWDAIDSARAMLRAGETRREDTIHLGPAIGQCCGGRVTLSFRTIDAEEIDALAAVEERANAGAPNVFIYGAGHVGRALARALAPLPFRVTLVDERNDELALADAPGVTIVRTDAPVGVAEQAPDFSAHVIMTHSHALDSLIAGAVMERGRFRYLGIIGSRTKRNSFRKAFREMGVPPEMIARVVCPIGGSRVKDKRPEVIAALAAAEIATALLSTD